MRFKKLYNILIMFIISTIIHADNCNDINACNYNPNSNSNQECNYPYECPNNSFECDVNECLAPNGFEWNQSSKILFLFVDYAFKFNSNFPLIKYEDWIGGFKSHDETKNGECQTISNTCPDVNFDGLLTDNVEVCIGSKYWNGDNNSEIPLMGFQSNNTLTNGYLLPGDKPYFKLFDSTNDSLYFMVPYKNGEPYEFIYSGNSSIEIMLIDSLVSQCPFYNNYDSDSDSIPDTCDACPNDSNNDIDNDNVCFPTDLCPYDFNNDIDGDGICACTVGNEYICNQIINDDPLINNFDLCPLDPQNDIDDDGLCGNIDHCPNDPFNLDNDNDGICDDIDDCIGEYDDCGVCNGGDSNKDCNGDCFGSAYLDDCDVCVGGNTLFQENEFKDCNNDCFGTAYLDNCGICSSGNSNHEPDSDIDCNGICFGTAFLDNCSVCSGGNTNHEANSDIDCNGVCFGNSTIDECGVCNGNNFDQCDYDNDGILNINDICPNDFNNDIDGDDICGDIDICPNDFNNDIDEDGICGDLDICPNDPENDIDQDNICGDSDNYPNCFDNFFDCFGECGGTAVYDQCGICNGSGNCECPDFDYGIKPDCNGVCGGNAIIDECGICDGSNIDKDCNGDCFGIAFLDNCGICSGGNSNHEANSDIDCEGICFGEALIDDCGICNGGDLNKDCNGDCFGNAYLDDCNICSGGNSNHEANSDQDCAGTCFGNLEFDECNICGGEGILENECDCQGNILDCNNVCGGNLVIDECGICGGENNDMDCNGLCFGSGIDTDDDGICDDIDNCIGEIDVCGICNGDGTWCLDANIYLGDINETHLEILYDSPLDVGGFQFTVSGINIINAFGGIAGQHNFNIANNNNTVLGFSLTGTSIPSGSGVLVMLTINYNNTSACFEEAIFSDDDGDPINVILDTCLEVDCIDSDLDTICDQVDDCFGIIDECGICNGIGIEEGFCDCNGNIEDCTGVCGGLSVIDDCNICGGNNYSMDCNGDCYGSAFIDYCGDCVGGNTNYEEGSFDLGCGCDYPAPMEFCFDSDGDSLGNNGTNTLFCSEGLSDEYEIVPDNWTNNCDDMCIDDIENDADGDGICESNEIYGCDDNVACNYDMLSTENDGSCIYFNFNNVFPENDYVFNVSNENIDDSILFEWSQPPVECNYQGNYRLQIYDNNNNPVYFTLTNENNTNVNYQEFPIEDSILNSFSWNIESIDLDFISEQFNFIIDAQNLNNFNTEIPEEFFISNTYPNPFNPQTSFIFGVPSNAKVEITIFNSIGNIIHKVDSKYYQAGTYKYVWNPKNASSGIYYIQLKSKDIVINKKTTYLK